MSGKGSGVGRLTIAKPIDCECCIAFVCSVGDPAVLDVVVEAEPVGFCVRCSKRCQLLVAMALEVAYP